MKQGLAYALLAVFLGLALPGSAGAFEPLSAVDSYGTDAGELEQPEGVAIGDDGSLYVADYGAARVSVFASDGTFVRAFGKEVNPSGGDVCTSASGCQAGTRSGEAGAMRFPSGVALGPEGDVFVADPFSRRIEVFASDGTFLRAFGKEVNPSGGSICTSECQSGAAGAGAGEFAEPAGVAFDESGLLYVADYGNSRIDVYSAAGVFLRAYGKEVDTGGGDVCMTACQAGEATGAAGGIRRPEGVAVGPAGLIAVADVENARVDVLSSDGVFLRALGKNVNSGGGDPDICTTACQAGESGPGAGAFDGLSDVAVDTSGNVYASDRSNERIDQFTLGGEFVRALGEGVVDGAAEFQVCTATTGCVAGIEGTIPGAVPESFGVAVDCRGAIYAAEETVGFARVERFGEPGTLLPPCPEEEESRRTSSTVRSGSPPPSSGFARALRFAGLRRNLRNGTAVLFVKVREPGRLILHGRGVRRLARGARRSGQRVRLPIKPKVRLMHFLRRHRKAAIRAKVTLRPADGSSQASIEKRVVLKRRHHRH